MEMLQRIYFLSRAKMLKPIRNAVRDCVKTQFLDEEVEKIIIAINEACMNIIQHAYKNISDGEIILEIWLKYNKSVVFKLKDFSKPIDKSLIKSRDLDDIRPGGLGVHLINEVMDQVEYLDNPDGIGNLLQMEKKLK